MRSLVRVLQCLLLLAALVMVVLAVSQGYDAVSNAKNVCLSSPEGPCADVSQVRATASVVLVIGALTCAVGAATMNGWGRPATRRLPEDETP